MYEPHYLYEGESRDTYLPGSSSRQQWVPRPNPGRLYLDKALDLELGGQSDRSACMTSTRAARAAGTADAMTVAASSTNAETITGRALGMRTSRKKLPAKRAKR